MSRVFLQLDEALEIHRDQVARYGGRAGLRDMRLLEAALGVPQAGFGDHYYHADLLEMAAAYLFHIVRNHPFLDGNKRTGAVAALLLLEMNGVEVRLSNEALVRTVVAVAEGKIGKSGVAEFLRQAERG